jgi:N4-gp56 family major capsid protein
MAAHDVLFATNDSLTRKRWAKDLYKILLPSVEFNYLVGTGVDSIVQMRTELGKGEGDDLTFGIRKPLVGEGVVGTDVVEGTEEKLRFSNFHVSIEELNHAVDTGGVMDEQRIPYNLMEEAKSALNDWWADKLSDYIMAVLCSDTTFTIAGKTFGPTIVAPDTNHWMTVGAATGSATAETNATAANYMDLSFLDKMKQRAELMNLNGGNYYKVRPLKIGGKNYYRVILHNYCFDILRQNMNAGQWGDIVRAGQKLQLSNVEFEYNGMIVSKSERVCAAPTNAHVYRNVLLGAQAACWAWGGAGESKSTTMAFVPYEADAKRYVMIRGGGILGCQKARFDSIDYGIVVGSAWGAAL